MKPTLYLETSIIGYLTAWIARDLVAAANQAITREWWSRKDEYDVYISLAVADEARAGDPDAVRHREELIAEIAQLDINDAVRKLSKQLIKEVPLPRKAQTDGLHIAVATVHGMNYLLTWNCTHIANAALRKRIDAICHAAGYEPPVICTPQELLGLEASL